jgi:circadian clock protein KaiB
MSRSPLFEFRLYVAGDTQNSMLAIANLTEFCRTKLSGRHTIDIVNAFQEPSRALADGILMTPTLVKLAPGPMRKVVGTLKHTESIHQALGQSAHLA